MGIVVTYAPPEGDGVTEHEIATRVSVAKALAGLKGYQFGGGYRRSLRRNGALYFVPSQTLSGDEARALGIRNEEDLFGGVVPFPFVATKAIAHPLPGRAAFRPAGWSDAFPERVRELVLPGFAAFTRADAREAARLLLANGPVRLKRGRGIGGRGQAVIEALDDAVFDALDETELRTYGLVVEPNLADLTTFSVGQVCVGGLRASYCGTQKETRDNQGETVYGGSDLLVARGGFDELERLDFPPAMGIAIEQAKAFNAAAEDEFEGLFASRRNYDVLRGRDASGRWLSGVLEQSWRIGGASGPEVAALAAFHGDARLRIVHARSTEAYDAEAEAPERALVHFRGVDSSAGPITKYTVVEPYEPAH
jgi:hypothetical protein